MLPLDDDHRAVAEAAAGFARRAAPIEATRERFADHAAGARPEFWPALLRQGLHALHLPERYGGGGAGLAELAVVVEQFGRHLLPGPYLPTVLTSAVVASLPDERPVGDLLATFADGATGALVTGAGLTAIPEGDGWVVDGESAPVLGLAGADVVIVRADDERRRPVWFRLTAGPSVTVRVDEGVDLTRSVGRLALAAHRVGPDDLLPALDPDLLDLLVNALYAAEASGLAAWCLDTAVEYVKVREQFGRPVGSFQAVQHKAALLLVRSEICCAGAWDAARAAAEPADQRRLAAAQAALTTRIAVDAALECVTLLGGVGFTWEHDVHLYWRRAISVAGAVGAEEPWLTRLGEAALDSERDFSFVAETDLPELRAQVGEVLDRVLDLPDDAVRGDGWAPARGGARQALLAEAGLVAPHYPPPYGLGAGPREQAVIAREFARRGLPRPSTVVGEWVLPTLLAHGTPQQRERFVGPTLRGEIVWCQLFSEPGAGSDLAGLITRARKVPGGWSLTGQKVWSSVAHEADWGICLARTDPEAPKHRGLSYFLVDMRSAGVDVRPLRQATGRAEFNEVFLDDVFVPDECLVGQPGEGWKLALTTLGSERVNMGGDLGHGSTKLVKRLISSGAYAASRAEAIRVLGRNTSREMSLAALNLRAILARVAGQDAAAQASVRKVFSAIAQREGSTDLLSLLGPAACAVATGGDYVIDHIGLPAVLFGGGTVEIQLNVIARRILRLPDARV